MTVHKSYRIMPPHCRHAVFTLSPTMMAGIHFYSHLQLLRSLLGWITTKISTYLITNAEHGEFLAIIQGAATFWKPGFVPATAAKLSRETPGELTCLILSEKITQRP